ncbi:MAG: sigma-70 family RNA polymerase sigma factor [Muribaculaceae bacterium]|nr:sigma-70 family RNA polymerase sigma factor [Muribaculaceae bacterium]
MAIRLRPVIVARAAKLLSHDDEAEDVAQDTLLKMWSLRHELDSYSSPQSLAMVIARNRCIDIMRHRCVTGISVDEAADILVDDTETDRGIVAAEYAGTTGSILSALPDSWQVIMRMRHIDGMENRDIAALIGSTESSVRVILSRARKRIKQMFLNSRPYE